MISRVVRTRRRFLFALKAGVVLAALIYITQQWGNYYVKAFLPLYREVINLSLRNYEVVSLSLSQQHTGAIVAAHLRATRQHTIGEHIIPVGVTVDASTLADHALKHVIIVISAILIWPQLSLRERGFRFLLSVPFIFFLEAVDIPLAIAGTVQDLLFFNLDPGYADTKPLLVRWHHMLDGGARLMLSIAVPFAIAAMRNNGNSHTQA